MRYREIQPAPALKRFIECFWTLESDPGMGERAAESILPDGCVELILNFGAPFRERKENGQEEEQPANFLVGQMTRPMMIAPTGHVQLLGVRFHPGGTFPFFRQPMHEMTNQVVELDSLGSDAGNIERDLVNMTNAAESLPKRIAAVESWLSNRARDWQNDSSLLELATNIVSVGGRISLDRLSAATGISGRQLERRFLREVGISPKLFCRILRFQQVFRAVEGTSMNWAAVANDCGYYDQAHLIRDFHQFAGQTPAALLAHPRLLTESFTRKNRMSHFSNTRL